MPIRNDFAAFILTNGRPDRVHTFETLRKSGYTGAVYLLVDHLDKTRERYIEKYGEQVITFNKFEIARTFDQGDNFNDMRAIIYARNASFVVAKELGLKFFIQLDDDYTSFQYRFDGSAAYAPRVLKNLDAVWTAMLNFYVASGIDSIAMAQGGDFIGGESGSFAQRPQLRRKCMNSFICSTDRPFQFVGRINEDVNTYTRVASTGKLFFTTNQVNLNQLQTQSNAGGMTETYLDGGTYLKSFYSVMYQPSSVKVGTIRGRSGSRRLHHKVDWSATVPLILRESIRKAD